MSNFESFSTGQLPAPENLLACHIPEAVLEDLLVKHLHPRGCSTPVELAQEIRLPVGVIDELITRLIHDDFLIDRAPGELHISGQRTIALTPRGRRRACDAFEESRYIGPAPVSISEYAEQCQRQRWDGSGISEEDLASSLNGVALGEETLMELRWALTTGGSLLVTGASGNGKSLLANRLGQLVEQSSESILVPYALWVDGTIVRIFDPLTHHPLDDGGRATSESLRHDLRWRQVRRPVIRVGSEMTRDAFEITRVESGGTHKAPFHVLANGGMLIADDLGRQPGSFTELMNRWLLPLEQQRDAILWPSGKRHILPVDAWIVLVAGDDAPDLPAPIARRIQCRLHLPAPDRVRFATLLIEEGRKQQMEVDEAGVEQLFNQCYNPHNPPKCSDPQNLLQAVESICRIQKETVRARADLLLSAARRLGLDGEQRAA